MSAEGPNGILADWSGMAWDSVRKKLEVFGGGHDGWGGNDVYSWNSQTGLWERSMLPSNFSTVVGNANACIATGGANTAPCVATNTHQYFLPQYLPVLDRFLVTVVASGVDDNGTTAAGPYLANPALFDPFTIAGVNNGTRNQKCGGSANSDVLGICLAGNMWQNRDTSGGTSSVFTPIVANTDAMADLAVEGGLDRLYVIPNTNGSGGAPYKYTFSTSGAASDTLAQVGNQIDSFSPHGGAYAASRQILLKNNAPSWPAEFAYWNMSQQALGNSNAGVYFTPTDTTGSVWTNFTSPTNAWKVTWAWSPTANNNNGAFYGWGGGPTVFILTPPATLPGTWTLSQAATPTGNAPASSETGLIAFPTGLRGLWRFIPGYNVFLGIQNYSTGAVWCYKP